LFLKSPGKWDMIKTGVDSFILTPAALRLVPDFPHPPNHNLSGAIHPRIDVVAGILNYQQDINPSL
jgi:hypothetical protein